MMKSDKHIMPKFKFIEQLRAWWLLTCRIVVMVDGICRLVKLYTQQPILDNCGTDAPPKWP